METPKVRQAASPGYAILSEVEAYHMTDFPRPAVQTISFKRTDVPDTHRFRSATIFPPVLSSISGTTRVEEAIGQCL
jgi:hypothetical protein